MVLSNLVYEYKGRREGGSRGVKCPLSAPKKKKKIVIFLKIIKYGN
jgi:hypothetical protein